MKKRLEMKNCSIILTEKLQKYPLDKIEKYEYLTRGKITFQSKSNYKASYVYIFFSRKVFWKIKKND